MRGVQIDTRARIARRERADRAVSVARSGGGTGDAGDAVHDHEHVPGREARPCGQHLLGGAVAVHRGDLQAVLLEAAGGAVRLGVEITVLEQTADEVVAKTADGSEEHADLLVGADGARSFVRASVAPSTPRYGK
jgi:2-polyprenyl-6-methoxyphenol hydroxylase-like FAD-dependent oxidoreductase